MPVNSELLREYKAEAMLLVVTLTWGLSFPLVKILLADISPLMLVFVRFLITLVLFVIIYRREIEFRDFQSWKYGLILGVLLYIGYLFQTVGMIYTTAVKSAFITGINLIFIPFAQYLVLKLRPGLQNVAGAVLVMTGLFLFTGAYIGETNIGDILTVFCAISFAIHIVYLSKFSVRLGFVPLAFGQFAAMSVLGLISTVLFEAPLFGEIRMNISLLSFTYLMFTSVISTLLSLVLMVKYQPQTTPLRAGIIYNFEAVFASVFAYFLLGETMTNNQLAAVVVMIAGLIISETAGLFGKRKITNEAS